MKFHFISEILLICMTFWSVFHVESSDVGMTFLPSAVRLVNHMMPIYEAADEGVGHHGNVVPSILKEIMDTCLIFTGSKKQEANKVSPT